MPKSERIAVPKRPSVGVSLTSEDEAMMLDLAGLQMQLKAVLDSHAKALEERLSRAIRESEERLHGQSRADFRALSEQMEALCPAMSPAKRSPSIVDCVEKQEVEREPDRGKAAVGSEAPVLVDAGGEREARRIVDECAEKLLRLQAQCLARERSKWKESLNDLLTRAETPEQPPEAAHLQLAPSANASRSAPVASGELSLPRSAPPLRVDGSGRPDCGLEDEAREHSSANLSAVLARVEDPLRQTSALSKASAAEDMHQLRSMKSQSESMKNLHAHFLNKPRRPRGTALEKAKLTVDVASTLLLLANVTWMAVATEMNMQHARNGNAAPEFFFWIDLSFMLAMCVEVVVKLSLYRLEFFFGPGRRWNAFDVVLIILAGVDLVLDAANLSFVRVLRGLRAIRATRVIRTAAMVPELRLMFASITASVASLFWAFVLIILVLFLCAMGVQQTVHSALETRGLANQHPELMQLYGTLPDTMLSLFMAISGGADWKDLADPLVHISRLYIIPYLMFIVLTIFGLLNILTAVFVEKTSNLSRVDPELVIQESLMEEAKSVKQLLAILGEADTDKTGTITQAEFEAKLEDPRFTAQMQLLDLNILEAQGIYLVLDHDRSGEIEIEQLVYGLIRMKGNARSMDINTLIVDNKRLLTKFAAIQHTLDANFMSIRGALAAKSHRAQVLS